MRSILLFTSFITLVSTASMAQDCLFEVLDTAPQSDGMNYSYVQEEEWTKDKFDELSMVYGLYCEEMFEKASSVIHGVYESNSILAVVQKTGNTDTHEVWDIQLFDGEKCFHIHFQFEVNYDELEEEE